MVYINYDKLFDVITLYVQLIALSVPIVVVYAMNGTVWPVAMVPTLTRTLPVSSGGRPSFDGTPALSRKVTWMVILVETSSVVFWTRPCASNAGVSQVIKHTVRLS